MTSAPQRICVAVLQSQADDAAVARRGSGRPWPKSQSMFGSASSAAEPSCRRLLVCLSARRPDGGTAAAIEQLELNPGGVDRAAHQPAQRIDFANQVPFRRAANRRIAGHVRDGVGGTACIVRRARPGERPHRPLRIPRGPRRSTITSNDRVAGIYFPIQKRRRYAPGHRPARGAR